MKHIIIALTLFTTFSFSAGNCDKAKNDYQKFNSRSLSSSNYTLKIEYARKAIKALRMKRDNCFLSGADKEVIYDDIKDIEDRIEVYQAERYKEDHRIERIQIERVN